MTQMHFWKTKLISQLCGATQCPIYVQEMIPQPWQNSAINICLTTFNDIWHTYVCMSELREDMKIIRTQIQIFYDFGWYHTSLLAYLLSIFIIEKKPTKVPARNTRSSHLIMITPFAHTLVARRLLWKLFAWLSKCLHSLQNQTKPSWPGSISRSQCGSVWYSSALFTLLFITVPELISKPKQVNVNAVIYQRPSLLQLAYILPLSPTRDHVAMKR